MKAVILESNGNLRYKDTLDPKIASSEYLIAVKYSGICNSDISRAYNNGAYSYPLIMGHEFSGVVEEIGKNVSRYKRGDRVAVFPLIPCKICEFCKTEDYAQCVNYDYYGSRRDGAFAQLVPVREWNLFPIPDDVSLEEAALLEPLSVAMHAVRKLRFKRDDFVAIFGAGLIGLAIAECLSYVVKKKNIFIIDRNDFKLSFAKYYGINTINPITKNDWVESIKKDTGGGVNHAIEACGAVATYKQSIDIVKCHGHVLWVGNITGDMTIEKKVVSSILRREVKIIGCWNSKYFHSKDDDWNHALQFIKKSKNLKKLITHKVKLVDGESIFKRLYLNKENGLKDRKEPFLKVMFDIS